MFLVWGSQEEKFEENINLPKVQNILKFESSYLPFETLSKAMFEENYPRTRKYREFSSN